MTNYEEADEFCPHCDNQYVIEAKSNEAQMVNLFNGIYSLLQ